MNLAYQQFQDVLTLAQQKALLLNTLHEAFANYDGSEQDRQAILNMLQEIKRVTNRLSQYKRQEAPR